MAINLGPMPGQLPPQSRPNPLTQMPGSPMVMRRQGGMPGQQMQPMPGQAQPGMSGGVGQAGMQGMAGQTGIQQTQPRTDYAARQRALLNSHLQQQGQAALQAGNSSSGGFFSKFFGSARAAQQAQTPLQQRAQAAQGAAGSKPGGFLSSLGLGGKTGSQDTGSYRQRRSDSFKSYRSHAESQRNTQKDLFQTQKKMERAKTASLQRRYAREISKTEKFLKKDEKALKKDFIKYKYTK